MKRESLAKWLSVLMLSVFVVAISNSARAELGAQITKTRPSPKRAKTRTASPSRSLLHKKAQAAAPEVRVIYFSIPPSAGANPVPPNPTSLNDALKVNCDNCSWTVERWLTHNVSVNSSGVFWGTPDLVQVFKTRMASTEGNCTPSDNPAKVCTHDFDVTVEVLPSNYAPVIISTSFPAQPVNQQYLERLAVGEVPELDAEKKIKPRQYVWSVDQSSLPPGLSADANGNITGTPTTAGTYTIKATVNDSNGQSDSHDVIAQIDASPGCSEAKYNNSYWNGWFPLSRKRNTDPLGTATWQYMTDADVQCFYVAAGPVAPLTQVQYIYGFGGGANTLSADLASFQIFAPLGTQVSLGTSVTSSPNQSSSSSSSTSTSNAPSNASALQSVEAGGDFYFHILYPVVVGKTDHLGLVAGLDPKLGFSFNGFAGQSTLSQGTEQYFNFPLDMNGSINGISNQGGAYFDYRGGYESVPGGFAKNAGLTQHNFYLNELSFGIKFAGLLQIGAQHFWGPSAAFNVSDPTGFNKWHLTLQLSPKI